MSPKQLTFADYILTKLQTAEYKDKRDLTIAFFLFSNLDGSEWVQWALDRLEWLFGKEITDDVRRSL